MIIYLDIVLLENIILNYIILLSTAIFNNSKTTNKRMLIASIIGGMFSILNYLANLSTIMNFILKILISICMIEIVFENKKINEFLKNIFLFYLISFSFGGIAFMLIFLVNPEKVIIDRNHMIGVYPIKMTCIAGILGFAVINIISKFIKINFSKNNMLYELEIAYENKTLKINTMLDTGNLLKEPISQKDVIIVEKECLEALIEKDCIEEMLNVMNKKMIGNSKIKNLKIIPYSSLGNENGILVGFKPDYIKVIQDKEILRKDIIIGIYDGKLTKTSSYKGLIGIDILTKEFVNNY